MVEIKKITPAAIKNDIGSLIHNGVPVTEALLIFCERNGLQPEDIGNAIKKDETLLSLITEEALKNNTIKKEEGENLDGFFS